MSITNKNDVNNIKDFQDEMSADSSTDTKKSSSRPYYEERPTIHNDGRSRLREQFDKGATYIIVIVACLICYFMLLRLDVLLLAATKVISTIKPVIYGLVIAYVLNPVVKWMDSLIVPFLADRMDRRKALKISRGLSVAGALVLLILIVVALVNMMLPELYKSIRMLIITLPRQMNESVEQISAYIAADPTLSSIFSGIFNTATESIQSFLRGDLLPKMNDMMSNLTEGIVTTVSEIGNILIGLMISIYVMYGKETFAASSKKTVYATLPRDHANLFLHMIKKANEIFGGFIIGKVIDSAIIGVLCFFAMSFLRMPYSLLVSVIVGITNIIPFFGPFIGAVPSAILIFLNEPLKGAYFIVLVLVLQQIDGNIIGPKIIGNSTGLPTFWVIFAILMGGGLFGIVGMILGVPTFGVVYYCISIMTERKLIKNKLPVETIHYGQYSYVDEEGKFIPDDIEIAIEEKKKQQDIALSKLMQLVEKNGITMERLSEIITDRINQKNKDKESDKKGEN